MARRANKKSESAEKTGKPTGETVDTKQENKSMNAKKTEANIEPEMKAGLSSATEAGNQKGNPTPQRFTQELVIDDSSYESCYANFCEISNTSEEMILDIGMNDQPQTETGGNIKVTRRIIMTPYTAKRLVGALSTALQRQEKYFGPIEMDPRRRVKRQ